MTSVTLLNGDGQVYEHRLTGVPVTAPALGASAPRVVYAAAHVVPRVAAENVPGAPADLDWDATLAFRHHIWSCGLGVADAMDTAQRNMGLDPTAIRELIKRSAAEAKGVGGKLVVGVNTDDVGDEAISLDEVVTAYLNQLEFAEENGADVVLMASRHLARAAHSPQDYERVYGAVLARATRPVVLHWLGPAFDSQLEGYFGSTDVVAARAVVRRIIEENVESVAGIKISLLDAVSEIDLRTEVPDSVRVFTGDDFNYVDLIAGDGRHHSDALLGAFATCAPVAAAALAALGDGDESRYRQLLQPTQALSREVFAAPTSFYKTGVAFLAWLNGYQPAFSMVGGLHAGRSLPHLSRLVRLADEARALERPELAAQRWTDLLRVNGIDTASVARKATGNQSRAKRSA
ncbi:DUF993 family protein [Mycolicibacterium sp. P9-64]|uniref:DUF993 family protein n=1 Tax=Mycolicibacterium sp. P9-64 TaxID=2024612 RepID=UPI0011EBC8A8|nr:DUF993 family protein [Mycolicibacterium sp. P9-64]KAA0081775.1 DUF993 family protein [Mycolicibacterium sp. P9-64]